MLLYGVTRPQWVKMSFSRISYIYPRPQGGKDDNSSIEHVLNGDCQIELFENRFFEMILFSILTLQVITVASWPDFPSGSHGVRRAVMAATHNMSWSGSGESAIWNMLILIDKSHKSRDVLVPYPTIHHSEQKCAHFCCEWCIVGYWTGALWDLYDWSIDVYFAGIYLIMKHYDLHICQRGLLFFYEENYILIDVTVQFIWKGNDGS